MRYTLDIVTDTPRGKIPFRVVYLPPGEPNTNFPNLPDTSVTRALVEFYDRRYTHTRDGQFVTRYFADTLLVDATINPDLGLDLDTGIPTWTIDRDTYNKVLLPWLWQVVNRTRPALDVVTA